MKFFEKLKQLFGYQKVAEITLNEITLKPGESLNLIVMEESEFEQLVNKRVNEALEKERQKVNVK